MFAEDAVAVVLKTQVLSAVESVQDFLLRRLSGELREVSVFSHTNMLNKWFNSWKFSWITHLDQTKLVCLNFVFIFCFQFCDLERAELYLSVLRELVLTYASVSWYGSNLQQNYIPKLTTNCLEILNEPSHQVEFTLKKSNK